MIIIPLITAFYFRRLIAISEKGDRPGITIFDTVTLKKKRSLVLPPEAPNKDIVNMVFSFDSKYLTVLCDEPDFMIYTFTLDKGKAESSYRCGNSTGAGGYS